MDRRAFLRAVGWIGTLVGGAASGLFLFVRYLFPRVLYQPPTRFKAGPPSNYPPSAGGPPRVYENFKASQRVWILHGDDVATGKHGIYSLLAICTHLGCTPNWLKGEEKFKCPCHGSGFYLSGVNFEGPAPRPLERLAVRIEDGELIIDKSKSFRQERGQWGDPEAFIETPPPAV